MASRREIAVMGGRFSAATVLAFCFRSRSECIPVFKLLSLGSCGNHGV